MISDINKYSRFSFKEDIHISRKNKIDVETIKLSTDNSGLSATTENNTYIFDLQRNIFSDNNENIIIILSRDNENILKYSLDKLYEFNINQKCDILLVDDRSHTNSILELSRLYNTSYLRIDNHNDTFNYSMLNNIAALYAKAFNKKRCIFYNNDLWPEHEYSLSNLIAKHGQYNSDITGCKLLYPTKKQYNDLNNPQHILDKILSNIYSTIQHGGIYFYPQNNILYPYHLWRFHKKDTIMANIDQRCFAVTGAIQIVNLDSFLEIGGFTPSLCSSFQDIDLCLKAANKNMCIQYIGSENMIHAESITHYKEKIHLTNYAISNKIYWGLFWNKIIAKIIGYSI